MSEVYAKKLTHSFMISNTAVEISPALIVREDPSDETKFDRLEGIKLKFNTEQSSTYLTINEMDSLVYNLTHLDIDNLALMLYTHYVKRNTYNAPSIVPKPSPSQVLPF